jgi:periplasmic protein CpxP/Spy
MKHWIKRILVTALGATLVLGSLSACTGGRHGDTMSESDMMAKQIKMVDYAGKKLDLNDAQKQRLTVLAGILREQRTALMGKTQVRADLQSIVAGTTLDKAKAQAMIEEKTSVLRSKSPEVIDAAADFYDSLNPTQQQQVRDLMQRRKGWRG